jgi:hypothetical protein
MVKRYKRGNKKEYIKEGHTIQWSKDTKEVIRNSISKKDIQYVLFLITSLVSFDHCIECPSLKYCFLLPLWYLLTIVYQRRTYNTMVKRYKRGNKKQYIKEGHSIQWSKDTKEVIRNSTSKKDIQYNGQKIPKRMSFFDVLFLITSFVSFDHCIVCPSLIYCFLLPLLYLLTIVLNVLL